MVGCAPCLQIAWRQMSMLFGGLLGVWEAHAARSGCGGLLASQLCGEQTDTVGLMRDGHDGHHPAELCVPAIACPHPLQPVVAWQCVACWCQRCWFAHCATWLAAAVCVCVGRGVAMEASLFCAWRHTTHESSPGVLASWLLVQMPVRVCRSAHEWRAQCCVASPRVVHACACAACCDRLVRLVPGSGCGSIGDRVVKQQHFDGSTAPVACCMNVRVAANGLSNPGKSACMPGLHGCCLLLCCSSLVFGGWWFWSLLVVWGCVCDDDCLSPAGIAVL